MNLPPLVSGRFVRRDNRFRATVTVASELAWAHVPNSGRLSELFTPDRRIWLAPAAGSHRKTEYDLKLVEFASTLVSVDARLPNLLFAEAVKAGQLPGFAYPLVEPEVTYGRSRLDFRLSRPGEVCWVETKSVTLVENGVALFPDAPTGRGRRHLQELIEARQSGDRAAVVFVVQRRDAERFTPHQTADGAFAATLARAAAAEVEILAFTCQVTLQAIAISEQIPVVIP